MIRNMRIFRNCYRFNRTCRKYSNNIEVNENEPIRFTTSSAARKTAIPVFNPKPKNDMPWYQPYSVLASVSVFLLYFCVFREENDVDLEFDKTLYDRIKGLEKQQLIQTYKYNLEHGKDIKEIEKRLQELDAEEKKILA